MSRPTRRLWTRGEQVDRLLGIAFDAVVNELRHRDEVMAAYYRGSAGTAYLAAAMLAEVSIIADEWPSFADWRLMLLAAMAGSSLYPAPEARAA